jgi:hypothetical protein
MTHAENGRLIMYSDYKRERDLLLAIRDEHRHWAGIQGWESPALDAYDEAMK